MKNKIVLCLIAIIIVAFIIAAYNNDEKVTFKEDGVMYAINVDGKPQDGFPTKGMYQVNVRCTNARGKWDYDNWKLYIDNITGDISCDIDFNTVTKTYLNEKIMSLSETTQGIGKLIYEKIGIPNYNEGTLLTENQYLSSSAYYNSYSSATSGTTVGDVFVYSGTEWTTNPSNMTSNKYYHFKFNVPEDGYYQMCYTMSSGSISNKFYLYGNDETIYINGSSYISASSSTEVSGCNNIGYMSLTDSLRVVQYAYKTTSDAISSVKFSLKKVHHDSAGAGYRYEGKNPNNYVWFNNELWRIIGVFDENSHGQPGENLVKIIREKTIGGLAWDKSEKNNWSTSSLKALLNGAYYNKQDGTESGYCYGDSETIKSNCNYSNIGINSSYRPMIKNVTWYLGGATHGTTEDIYKYERDETRKVYSAPVTDTGYIGLMYASDYGYSTLANNCSRLTKTDSYSTSGCAGESWLYGKGDEWTITLCTGTNYSAYIVYNYGTLRDDLYTSGSRAVRPVLYLDASVYLLDGDGTMDNPYIIGM